jgi:hypothetical protein
MDQERLDQEAKQNEDILKALSEADKALDIAQKQKDLTTEERLANELKKSGRVTVLNLDTKVTNLDEIKIPEPLKEIKVSNLGEIKLPEINIPEYPTSMKIDNWSEMPMPAMQKFPDHIGIRKPAWLPLLFTPLRPIKEVLDEISAKLEFKPEQKQKIEFPTSDEDAIAVRVINQQPQMIGGGFSSGGSSVPTVKTTDGIRAVPIVNPDGTTITAGGAGSAAYSNAAGTDKKGLVDADRHVQVDVLEMPAVSVDTTGLALDATLTGGTQKSQIVDSGGEAVTVTGGKLDVNASVDTTGLATSAKQLPDGHSVALSATDNAVLDTIDSAIDAINAKLVTGTVIGDVNLGATDNAVLDTIDAVLDTINAKMVSGTDIGDVTINNASGAAAVNIQDGGNTITVDGAVTTSGTVTEASGSDIKTSVQLIDDAIYASDGALNKSMVMGAVLDDASTVAITENQGGYLRMSSRRALLVEGVASGTALNTLDTNSAAIKTAVETIDNFISGSKGLVTEDNSGAIKTSVELIDNAISGAGFNITQLGGANVPIGAGTEAAAIRVTLPTNGTGIVGLATGTNAIGKLAANSGIDIGDVDVTSLVPGTGATNLGKAEDATHNSGDTGVMSLAVRDDDPVAALSNAEGDYSPLHLDGKGVLWTRSFPDDSDLANSGSTHVKKYYTSAGAVTDGIIWSPAAGKRWFVTDIFLQVSADATVTIEDDKAGGDDPIWKAELKAGSGWSQSFRTPWFSGEDAADLMVTTTAGNVYITVTGYEI